MLALEYGRKWIEAVELLSEVFRVDESTIERLLQSLPDEERTILVEECGHSGPTLNRSSLEYNTVGYRAYVRALGRLTEVAQEMFIREIIQEEAVRC